MLISPSQIVTQSWQFYKSNWRQLVPYMILSFLPTIIVECLGIMGIYLYSLAPSLTLISKIVIILVLAATFVFDIWISIALTRAAKNLIQKEPESNNWQKLFSGSSHLIWPAFYTSILIGLAVFFGLILFLIPGIIFTVWYGFAFYAVVLEDKKGTDALKHSKQMVVGRWWAIFVRLFLPFALFMIIGSLLRYALVDPISLLPFNKFATLVTQSTLSTVINVLMMPFFYGSGMLLYLSAKNNAAETIPQV
ncbi:MAG: hypothetical protein WCX97_02665 [Candidatus Magasanikbacteria bacterium]